MVTRLPDSPVNAAGEESLEAWCSVEAVAAHLGVRKDSIYRWIEQRGLPAQKIGKLWKFKLSEVDAWMRADGKKLAPRARGVTPETVVMVVDDDETLRETLSDFLGDDGYAPMLASDGAMALSLLRAPGAPRPRLIILDLHMPGMDGWTFREVLQRDEALSAIPVVVLTAERRVDLRGPAVLVKPIDLGLLGIAVRTFIGAK